MLCPHRITIITGHYGTGKTEFAVNLALHMAQRGDRVTLADLDIVNPYFRSRERRDLLTANGVSLISSSQACSDADVPSLPPQLHAIMDDRRITGILDIGGDKVGARVLARYRPRLIREDYQLLYVLNANRPEVRDVSSAITYLRDIESVTGLRCFGIVNNTHLCGETTPEDVRKGAALAMAVSEETGIPIVCHVAHEDHISALSDLREPLFPIQIRMKKPWEYPTITGRRSPK